MVNLEERKKAFVVFASTYEAAKYLTLEQKGELFEKLGAYSLEGKDVHSDNPMIDIILISAFPNMDAAERRHQTAIENGSKSKNKSFPNIGRPHKGETREEYEARRNRALEEGLENPQKPLNNNTNININTNSNIDKDREIKTDTDIEINRNTDTNIDIKKNTNVEVISNSISTDTCSVHSNSSSIETEYDDYPSHETELQRQCFQQQSKEYFEEPSNEEYYLPPMPEEGKMNYVGTIEEIISRSALQEQHEMDGYEDVVSLQNKPSKEEMVAAIRAEIDEAIACRRDELPYMEHMYNARDIYMDFMSCNVKTAQEDMDWLFTMRKSGDQRDFLGNYL